MGGAPIERGGDVENAQPWRSGVPGEVVLAATSKGERDEEQRRVAEVAVAQAVAADFTVYTDGAAVGGIERG